MNVNEEMLNLLKTVLCALVLDDPEGLDDVASHIHVLLEAHDRGWLEHFWSWHVLVLPYGPN